MLCGGRDKAGDCRYPPQMLVDYSEEQSENEIKEKITTGTKMNTCIFTKGPDVKMQKLFHLLTFNPHHYF